MRLTSQPGAFLTFTYYGSGLFLSFEVQEK